jgi:hypothetical protein
MVYTVVAHLYTLEGKEVEEKVRAILTEAAKVFV